MVGALDDSPRAPVIVHEPTPGQGFECDPHAVDLGEITEGSVVSVHLLVRFVLAPFGGVAVGAFRRLDTPFLAAHPEAVVLHLGCGLDSRFLRVQPGPGVDWYDIDYPEVARLRERFYPARPGHRVVAALVTDPAWLAAIRDDRPTLMVAEGLTMYLTEDDGIALLRRIVDRFPVGELHFDAFNWLGIKTQWSNAVVRRSGATLHWAINSPDDIVTAVPGTTLLHWVPVFELDVFSRIGGGYGLMAAVLNRIPGVRTMAQFHRYAY